MTGLPTKGDPIYPDDWPPELPKRAYECPADQDNRSLDEQIAHQIIKEPTGNEPDWIDQVKAAWRKSIEGIVETGRWLLIGHASMPPAEFDALVPRRFEFSASMARKLMVIAKDERITNCAIWHKLPRTWTTVYELTKLDDETFDTMLREGSINPVMTKLVVDSAVRLEKHRNGAGLNKLPKKLAKTAAETPLARTPTRSEAEDLHDLLTRLVALMRATPPNAASAVALLLPPEERRDVAGLALEAINWLSSILDAASLVTREETRDEK